MYLVALFFVRRYARAMRVCGLYDDVHVMQHVLCCRYVSYVISSSVSIQLLVKSSQLAVASVDFGWADRNVSLCRLVLPLSLYFV